MFWGGCQCQRGEFPDPSVCKHRERVAKLKATFVCSMSRVLPLWVEQAVRCTLCTSLGWPCLFMSLNVYMGQHYSSYILDDKCLYPQLGFWCLMMKVLLCTIFLCACTSSGLNWGVQLKTYFGNIQPGSAYMDENEIGRAHV